MENLKSRISKVVTKQGDVFTPDWTHAHGQQGFVLGFKGSAVVVTVPATEIAHVEITYESPEAVESIFNPKVEDDHEKSS